MQRVATRVCFYGLIEAAGLAKLAGALSPKRTNPKQVNHEIDGATKGGNYRKSAGADG